MGLGMVGVIHVGWGYVRGGRSLRETVGGGWGRFVEVEVRHGTGRDGVGS